MFNISSSIFGVFLVFAKGILFLIFALVGVALLAFVLYIFGFFVRYRVNLKTPVDKLIALEIKSKGYDLFRWKLVDYHRRLSCSFKRFPEFGFSVLVGKQGAGKTIALVDYLERMRELYPECLIVTNFKYDHAHHRMTDWRDFFEIRNGEKGVIFAIDEIHSEYDSSNWRDFPESLLSEISQQRKQCIKIVATSQVFLRLAKPMREQTFSVIECKTFMKRLTRCKEYDAFEYGMLDTLYNVGKKIKPIRSYSFVQSDYLRNCYDTYEKIERLSREQFIPRNERGTSGGVISRIAT